MFKRNSRVLRIEKKKRKRFIYAIKKSSKGLKNDAHTEAFQQAKDENDAELIDIQAIFQDAFELKYVESYDLGYIIGFVGWDHQDGWDAYNKMAKIKKANFLIPPNMSNEIVELEASERTRLSDDFDDGSRSDSTCQLQSCSRPSVCC
ncbi:hypothetical protein ACFX2I_003137 [Malus domestica]